MPQFIPMESLFFGTFGPIGALAAILELNEYVEPLTLAKKGYCVHRLAIFMFKIFGYYQVCATVGVLAYCRVHADKNLLHQ